MADNSMSVLVSGGMDAFSNLYDVDIYFPDASSSQPSTIPYAGGSVRSMGFTPPELVVGEYTVAYKGVKITRPNAKITGAREFTIDFRSDSDYALLTQLNAWKNQVVDPTGEGEINFGTYAGGTTPVYGKVVVTSYKANSTLTADSQAVVWTFTSVICTNIGSPSFTRQGIEPTRISAKFMFMDYTIDYIS